NEIAVGLTINAANVTVRGLVINGFRRSRAGVPSAGILVDGSSATGAVIAGNFLGTDPTGTTAPDNDTDGVIITGGASRATIGGTDPADRNVISGNRGEGILLDGADDNVVQGNYIGTNAAGTGALANGNNGVFLTNGAADNLIGGTADGARNVISGNVGNGI